MMCWIYSAGPYLRSRFGIFPTYLEFTHVSHQFKAAFATKLVNFECTDLGNVPLRLCTDCGSGPHTRKECTTFRVLPVAAIAGASVATISADRVCGQYTYVIELPGRACATELARYSAETPAYVTELARSSVKNHQVEFRPGSIHWRSECSVRGDAARPYYEAHLLELIAAVSGLRHIPHESIYHCWDDLVNRV